MLDIKIDWEKAGRDYIAGMPEKLRDALIEGMLEAMNTAADKAALGLDPQSWVAPVNPPPGPLVSRSEDLMYNIAPGKSASIKAGVVTGFIQSDLHYSALHEFGGVNDGGHFVPPRPFLMPAINDNLDEIREIIEDEIIEELNK